MGAYYKAPTQSRRRNAARNYSDALRDRTARRCRQRPAVRRRRPRCQRRRPEISRWLTSQHPLGGWERPCPLGFGLLSRRQETPTNAGRLQTDCPKPANVQRYLNPALSDTIERRRRRVSVSPPSALTSPHGAPVASAVLPRWPCRPGRQLTGGQDRVYVVPRRDRARSQ